MAPRTPNGPTTPNATLQDGVDCLWKFQLRKENAALLEKQDAHTKLLQSLAAETVRNKKDFDERIAALETTVLNLQRDEKKDRHAFEKWGEEMATLKAQMGGVMDKVDTHDQRLVEAVGTSSARPSPRSGAADIIEVPNVTVHNVGSTINKNTLTSTKTSTYSPAPMPSPAANPGLHTTNHATDISTTDPMARSRSRSGTRSASTEAATNPPQAQATPPDVRPKTKASASTTTPTPIAQTAKMPRLRQGTNSLKIYLQKGNAIFQSLPGPKDQKFEIEFIAMFIKGMRDEDKRDTLVGELQQQHQSRTKKDGKIEILCKWKDVGEGMRSSELIATEDSRAAPKDKAWHRKKADRLLKELTD